jgi:predicted transposase YdaD
VVRQEADLGPTSRRLVERQPELSAMIATILWKRLPQLSLEQIMTIAGIQLAELSETRAYQDILAKGREEGLEQGREEGLEQGREEGLEQGLEEGLEQGLEEGLEQGLEEGLEEGLEQGGQREAGVLVLKLLQRRFGSVTVEQEATIRGLSTAELEELAEALLGFASPGDLEAWLASGGGN